MGSLNGDVMVRRNGRTTSQVSVYNYPEHLNPFYEDDQHKRLRFWKISKKDNEGRRNSFSIANLRDMWSFKTFRMKKKSSTLGINKTSESPPLLRRDYVLDNAWNTFDNRLRASNTSSINGESFQRNATYRSSLQTLPTNNDRIGLNRNDGYRSTIQVPRSYPRYQPQHQQQQHLQQSMGVSQNRRSSQSSMVSSNPFESDDDDVDENEDINSIGMRNSVNGSTTTLTSRTPRKKRRAPAPPTSSIHSRSSGAPLPTIRIDPSHDDSSQDELHIKEDNIDIANLTAEIESFVKTKNNDDIEVTQEDDAQITTVAATTSPSAKNTEVEVKKVAVEKKTQEIITTPKHASKTVIVTEDLHTLPNEAEKVKTETVATVTKTTTAATDVTEPVKKEIKVTQVSNEIDENKEIKINGAIPKKPTNSHYVISSIEEEQHATAAVADLCIKETYVEELPKKPIPLKRQTKPETEVGHVECIHVHVESPRATPRKDHPSGLSSFKTTETVESPEIITTKTPFVLTSPPTTPRRNRLQAQNEEPVTKETVKITGTSAINERINNELNIKEERINAKPEILVKPTLSPKPFTNEQNGKAHGFAEIHKPMRKSNPNGKFRKSSRDGSISPPFVPEHKRKEEEEKINNTVNFQINGGNEEKAEPINTTIDNLKIIETATSVDSNGVVHSIEEKNVKEIKESRITSNSNSCSALNAANQKEMQKRDDEYEFLYRPKPVSQMEWKRSTLAPLETNIPPEKRKSVKDIIESINRSQRLLNAAANKDFTVLQNHNSTIKNPDNGSLTTHHSSITHNNNNNNSLNENLKILNERQQEIQCFVEEMASTPSTNAEDSAGATNSPSPSPSNCNNECSEAQKLDNDGIFQKCKVKKEVYDYRETSPITSNLDWNPVPKPKRTKAAHE